jgi:hypothetical protein
LSDHESKDSGLKKMGKRTKGKRPARGFGNQPALPDEELIMLSLLTQLALNIASEQVAELDRTKTKDEWVDWFMEQAQYRLSETESEEEMEALFLNM